jgi:hypothetical protein
VAVIRPTEVHKLYQSTDLNYPRLLAGHPRNEAVDFSALGRYAEQGMATDPVHFELFVKSRRQFDAAWIAGIAGPLVSIRLRRLLEDVVGECLEFLPLTVNGEPFWIMRVSMVVDALDVDRSKIDYSVDGNVQAIQVPVWLGERLRDPPMFTLPQERYTIYATPGVVAAYEGSGCDGLTFGPRGTVA